MKQGLQLQARQDDEAIQPKICVPLVGESATALRKQLKQGSKQSPEVFEWRVDYFEKIKNIKTVTKMAKDINRKTKRPLLFTRRSEAEGGQATPLAEKEVVNLYEAVIKNKAVQGIDIELSQREKDIRHLQGQAQEKGIDVVLSYHNFMETPPSEVLKEKINNAVDLGADVAKIAVMPQSKADVLKLLQVTEEMSREIPLPLISMAMGGDGMISRLAGGIFGSALTFASGSQSSAPGQLPLADVEQVLRILDRNM
ncbi:type I 3-dehydroquinate dehydratase [Natribacillus halophilus]|uniref:3-dehydroquinate dehydratase n=1 Tax=Natribacillus halophilus TaxID=549003 RepID=A0A1G8KYG3_9BACI|nr:type I 3-dehydroquinate dehydratase [Natribacillus halophilus]SDI48446.1 3-dehydroquinate dehydratase [Natribacillus halophilus]